jgi:hypothetical protein
MANTERRTDLSHRTGPEGSVADGRSAGAPLLANMVEVLIRDYCESSSIPMEEPIAHK